MKAPSYLSLLYNKNTSFYSAGTTQSARSRYRILKLEIFQTARGERSCKRSVPLRERHTHINKASCFALPPVFRFSVAPYISELIPVKISPNLLMYTAGFQSRENSVFNEKRNCLATAVFLVSKRKSVDKQTEGNQGRPFSVPCASAGSDLNSPFLVLGFYSPSLSVLEI